LPLLENDATVVKKRAPGSAAPSQHSSTTGGRVFFQSNGPGGTGQSGLPRFSP
jgi:hypothetical protein